MTPRGHLGRGRRADPSRGVPRICHTSKDRNQDILAKELTKGCAGRTLFSGHWRAELCANFPSSGPAHQACLAVPAQPFEPDEVVSKPNGALTTALFLPSSRVPWPQPIGVMTPTNGTNLTWHMPQIIPSGVPFSPGTRCDHPRGLVPVECTQADRLRRVGTSGDLTSAV